MNKYHDLKGMRAAEREQERWLGCQSCDCSFPCHDGKAPCIRLPLEQQNVPKPVVLPRSVRVLRDFVERVTHWTPGGHDRHDALRALAELERSDAPLPDVPTQTAYPSPAEAMEQIIASKDAAYRERNQLVSLLAAIYPSGTRRTAIPGWSEDWHGCVYIDLPTGQASWHYHDTQAHLFAHLPAYDKPWDGHTTPEKYDRVNRLTAMLYRGGQMLDSDLASILWKKP